LFDNMLAAFVEPLLDAAAITSGDRWCSTSVAATGRRAAPRRVAPPTAAASASTSRRRCSSGHARARPTKAVDNVEFVHADAQDHEFAVRRQPTSMISRFGVMFFADPVAAFANLGAMLRPGGRVAFVCWQALFANQWVAVPARGAGARRRRARPATPDAPGPFSFADRDRVHSILDAAGFTTIEIDGLHVPVLVGGGLPWTRRSRSSARVGWESASSATPTRPRGSAGSPPCATPTSRSRPRGGPARFRRVARASGALT
jgi:SAM-dependent methyltransferase